MTEKMTCPGCNAHTSAALEAYADDEPCPYCGLSAAATREILTARSRHADAELTKRYADAELRASRAEAEVVRLRDMLQRLRDDVAWIDSELAQSAPTRR